MTTSIFREIKKRYPNSKLTVLANPIAKQIIEKNKNVDEIVPIGLFWRNKNLKSWIEYFKILKKLKKEKYDVGINARSSILNSFFSCFYQELNKDVHTLIKEEEKIF